MKILLLNQAFHPDVVSSGQHLTDLALALTERGHEVTVLTSRRAYDDPRRTFLKSERWKGVRIVRVASSGFGKGAKWKRAADFASFLTNCAGRLALLPRQDAVVAMTSPPLIAFLGALVSQWWRARFFYWVLDLNPDEAIAAGWLRKDSFVGRLLEWLSRFSLRRSEKVFALDRFMRERILAKGIDARRVVVIPPWSHDGAVRFDPEGRERFRNEHGLRGKFVVMYSGNHSPCHPLDTLMEAMLALRDEPALAFCFVGGGSEFSRVRDFAVRHRLSNVTCLPYQPLDQLSRSLSAADLHVVVMGDPFVGVIHPCKIYNILSIGAPVLYIGPKPSHLSEVFDDIESSALWAWAPHHQVDAVIEHIRRIVRNAESRLRDHNRPIVSRYAKAVLLPQLIADLESKPGVQERLQPNAPRRTAKKDAPGCTVS